MLFLGNTQFCISEIYTQSIFRKLFNQVRTQLIHDFPETQNGGAVILDHLDCQKHGLDEKIKLGQGFWAQMLFSDKAQNPKTAYFGWISISTCPSYFLGPYRKRSRRVSMNAFIFSPDG